MSVALSKVSADLVSAFADFFISFYQRTNKKKNEVFLMIPEVS